MGLDGERKALCQLPLAEEARFNELPMLIQAYELGIQQARRIHEGNPVCVQTVAGGANGSIGSFYERYPSKTMFDYSQMLIAAGVLLEELRDSGGYLEVVDSNTSNGSLSTKQVAIQDIDVHCVRAQLLGLSHAFDGRIDDYRVVGIIGEALRNDILNPKVRKQKEREKYAEMIARLQEK